MEATVQLAQFIRQVSPLKTPELDRFLAIWTPFSCKRKTVLTVAGETERHLYFVLEGVQRAFYVHADRPEATVVFTYPPSFSGVADSFLTQKPSAFFFETLTASSFLRCSHQQMQELMHELPAVQELVLQLTAHVLKGVLERQAELQCFSAEDKFRALMRRSPHVLQLIPHKYLASYLGIDPATFSKLLGAIRI